VVQFVLLIVGILIATGVAVGSDDALAAALGLTGFVLVIVGYPVAFETLTRGRSLGKMALGLRVVREDGGPIRFRHALVRGLLGVVEIWITYGIVALVVSLASSKGKRLGDFLAGTVVVHERMPSQGGAVVMMPPPLAGWAVGLDLARLPDDLALAARQYLSRAGALTPEVRDAMGGRLAAAVAACTTPPPPPGTPAWAYLSAVLAERRRREMARMMPPPPPGWGGPPTPPGWDTPPQPAPGWGTPQPPYPSPAPAATTPPPPPPPPPPAPPPAPSPAAPTPAPGDRDRNRDETGPFAPPG
jgi:uncharacterized RDD family membrane protein YckC